MKKISFVFLVLILNMRLFSRDYSFFKHLTTTDIDYYTGENLFSLYNTIEIKDSFIVDTMKIEVVENTNKDVTIRTFSSGILTQQYTKVFEETYYNPKYNDKGYIETVLNQRREYPEDNVCLIYKNGKFDRRITIDEQKECFIVTVERKKADDTFFIIEKLEYYYNENKQILKIKKDSFNQKGTKTRSLWDIFYYDENNKLVKQEIYYDEILNIVFEYFYNSQNNLEKIKQTDLTDLSRFYSVVFSNYDSNGNWLTAIDYIGEKKYCEVFRIITYK